MNIRAILPLLFLFFCPPLIGASTYSDSVNIQLLNTESDTIKVLLYLNAAEYQLSDDREEALDKIKKAIELATLLNEVRHIGLSYKMLGKYYFFDSQFKEAIENFLIAKVYFEEANAQYDKASALNWIGKIYIKTGNYYGALEKLNKVEHIIAELNDSSSIALVHNNLGAVYQELGYYELAVKYYKKALYMQNAANNQFEIALLFNNLGEIALEKKELKRAKNYFNKSISIHKELGNLHVLGLDYTNLALSYTYLNQFDSAQIYFEKALSIGNEFDDQYAVLNTKCGYAFYYNQQQNYDKAIEIATLCLKKAKDIQVLSAQKKSLQSLYVASTGKKDFEQALIYHVKLVEINDSLNKGGDQYEINQVELNFDLEQRLSKIQKKADNTSLFLALLEKDWFILLFFFIMLGVLVVLIEFRTKKTRKKEGVDTSSISYLRSSRVLYFIAAILYFALPNLVPYIQENVIELFFVRLSISTLLFLFFILTYLSPWVRDNLRRITKTFYFIMIAHMFVLIYINNIGLDPVFNLTVLLAGLNVVFKKFKPMFYFSLYVVISAVIIGVVSEEPTLDPLFFVTLVVSFVIVSMIMSYSHAEFDRHLEFSNEAVNQADAIVFIINRKGENIYTSQSITNVLGYDPQDLSTYNWIEKLGVSKKEANKIKHNFILIAIGSIQPVYTPYQKFKAKNGDLKWLSMKEKRLDGDRVLVLGLDVTEQKKIQDELVESERNFRQINETLSDAFYLYNIVEQKYEYFSPNVTEILGATPEFLYSGQSHIDTFVIGEDREKVRVALERLEKGYYFDIEYRIRIGHDLKWIREKSNPVRDEYGTVIKFSGLCQDITEKKKSEQEITELSLIASNTENFILMVNAKNKIEWANQSFYNLTGYIEREVFGSSPLALISGPKTSEIAINEITQAIFIDKTQHKCEMVTYKKNEELFFSSLELTPLLDFNGDLEKYFIIGSDISQRKIDQEQIEKLSLVASNTSNYVIIANTVDGIEWVNQAFTDKFGYTLNDVRGLFPSEFLYDEEKQKNLTDEINQTVFVKKKKFMGEIIHLTKSRKEVFANVNITPIFSEANDVVKYFVLGVDLSEKKKNLEKIEKTNIELVRKEKELYESDQNFRELIKSIKEVFWLADAETNRMLFVSDSYEHVFGRPSQSLIDSATSWRSTIHPDDFDRVVERVEQDYSSGTFDEVFRIILDSGEEKWIHSRIFPIINNEGKTIKYSGFVEDITLKKKQDLTMNKILDQLDMIHAIEKTILASESTEDIIYNTLAKTLDKLPVLRVSCALFNEEQQTFYSYAKMKGDYVSITDKQEFKLSDFSLYELLKKNKTNHIEDLTKKEIKSKTDEILISEGAKLALLSPLVYNDELIGSLNVCFTETKQRDTTHYIKVTNEVANGLAIAIHQSQLKEELYYSNRAIKASIDYAKMIQQAYVPTEISIDGCFTENFIINRPKDVVSGDFYWVGSSGSVKVLAVGDCTGHGVPGAFMTIIGISELNNIVNLKGVTDPAEILKNLNIRIVKALSSTANVQLKDGMDIGILCYDTKDGTVTYEGARIPLYHYGKNGLKNIVGTRLSIGGENKMGLTFTSKKVQFEKGDDFYMFSDGFTDQFGGEKTRKFSRVRLEKLIESVSDKSANKQKEIIEQALVDWQGHNDQIDDILFVGFNI